MKMVLIISLEDLEAKNAELEIEAKKYQLLYRNSLISLVDKDIVEEGMREIKTKGRL